MSFPELEHPFLFWNVLFLFFVLFWENDFVPGHPGTEEFVPGFLLLPLSRDKETPGQEHFFVPGQRDVLSRFGNASLNPVAAKIYYLLLFREFQLVSY